MVVDTLDHVWKFKTWPFFGVIYMYFARKVTSFSLFPQLYYGHGHYQCSYIVGIQAIFCQAGAVNRLPKKFSQVAQIFTTQLKRNESHKMQQHRPTIK